MAAEDQDRPGFAIGLYLSAMIVFVTMDGLAKYATAGAGGLEPELLMTLRYILVVLLLAPIVVWRWRARPLSTSQPVLHILRGVLLIGAGTIFVFAIRTLPLETATAISFVSPLLVTIFSVFFLSEKVGIRRWAAVLIGFVGVLAILRPGTAAFTPAMLLPLLSSCCWAGGLIITRKMRGRERPFTVLAWTTAVGLLVIAPFGFGAWQAPTAGQWLILALIAGCHIAGQLLTIRAFMLANASLLAPFSYTTILWAALVGFFAFGTLPDLPTGLGAAVLAAAGLYVWRRERTRHVAPTTPGASILVVEERRE